MSKKDTYYFSHDYNSRSDEKIKKLFMKHGIKGYGIFWALIEDLYNNANALRTDYESIAFELREDISLIESVIKNFDLFVIDGDFFGSLSVERRLSQWKIKSEQASEAANKRWEKTRNKHKEDATAQENKCERIATAQENNASGDAIQYNTIQYDIKENDNKINLPENPTMSEQKQIFELFRIAYPGTKRSLETEFTNFTKKHKDWKNIVSLLLPAIEKEIEHKAKEKDLTGWTSQYKMLQTWINQKSWEQELPALIPKNNNNQSKPKHEFEKEAEASHDKYNFGF